MKDWYNSGTLAPWCVEEQWEIGIALGGKPLARVTGRTIAPGSLKRNPLWWTQNSTMGAETFRHYQE